MTDIAKTGVAYLAGGPASSPRKNVDPVKEEQQVQSVLAGAQAAQTPVAAQPAPAAPTLAPAAPSPVPVAAPVEAGGVDTSGISRAEGEISGISSRAGAELEKIKSEDAKSIANKLQLPAEDIALYAEGINLPNFEKRLLEAQDMYKQKVEELGTQKAWVAMFSLLGHIAAGVYGVQHGVDTSGIKFDQYDWALEYNKIMDNYKMSADIVKSSYEATTSRYEKIADMIERSRKERKGEVVTEAQLKLEGARAKLGAEERKATLEASDVERREREKFIAGEKEKEDYKKVVAALEKRANAQYDDWNKEIGRKGTPMHKYENVGSSVGLGTKKEWEASNPDKVGIFGASDADYKFAVANAVEKKHKEELSAADSFTLEDYRKAKQALLATPAAAPIQEKASPKMKLSISSLRKAAPSEAAFNEQLAAAKNDPSVQLIP